MNKNPDYNYKITVEMTEKTLHDYMKYRTKTNAGTIFPYLFVAVFIYELIKTWGEVSMLQSAFYLIFAIKNTFLSLTSRVLLFTIIASIFSSYLYTKNKLLNA